jgi:hypothetical protein
VGKGLLACAGLYTPSPDGKHRQGEELRGPVQRRRECGTLYDSPSILHTITAMCVINLCYVEWLLHSSKKMRTTDYLYNRKLRIPLHLKNFQRRRTMEKRIILSLMSMLFLLITTSCSKGADLGSSNIPLPENTNEVAKSDTLAPTEVTTLNTTAKDKISPYLSITYGINDDTTDTGRRTQYYTYNIDEKKLDIRCSIPFAAQYGTGVVSLANQKVYYSGRTGGNANDSLMEYDMKSGETKALENENATYNDIAIVDNHTLLVTAISRENGCNWPATFDLNSRAFTYLYDANNISDSLYSTRAGRINYNYIYNKFVDVFVNQDEFYTSKFRSNEVAIDYNIALVSPNLLLNTKNIFAKKTKIADDIYMETQISDNSILLQVVDLVGGKRFFYLLDLVNKSIKEIDCPFKNAAYVTDCVTLDQGKTYFVLGGFQNGNEVQKNGLFYYDTNTKQAEPILMNNDSIQGHVINFTIVGDRS